MPDILNRIPDKVIGSSYQSDKIARIYKYNKEKFDINKVKNPSSHLKNAFPKPKRKQSRKARGQRNMSWMELVKSIRTQKNIPFKEAMIEAKKVYKK
jgi:hypothetical protein